MTQRDEQHLLRQGLRIILLITGLSLLASTAILAEDLFSDEPMESKVQSAPPNVTFILDNSGSMLSEFITPENGGTYRYGQGNNGWGYGFLYDTSGQAYYTRLPEWYKDEWATRWSAHNQIFYNPHSNYEPWANWEDLQVTDGSPTHQADLVNPRTNPVDSGDTKNILAKYTEFEVSFALAPIIVDNEDATPSYVEYSATGVSDSIGDDPNGHHWTESDLTPEFNDSARYTSYDDEYAVFTPDIPTTGDYKIYTFINCYASRDKSAQFELDSDGDGTADNTETWDQHASQSNVAETGVCGEWVPMFSGNTFSLNAGQHATVTIRRDTPYGDSTLADAVKFVLIDSTVDINLAHYFVTPDPAFKLATERSYEVGEIGRDVYGKPFKCTGAGTLDEDNDSATDGDKTFDFTENKGTGTFVHYTDTYLVNFVWSDSNGNGDVDADELSRDYYLVDSITNSDGRNEVDQIYPLTTTQVQTTIAPIIPLFTNADGSERPRTDLEDLQNFANWFSFYRRRDLTAKAAVGRTVRNVKKVYIGFYSLNTGDGGIRQTVLPVKIYGENTVEIVSDNRNSSYTNSGNADGEWEWYRCGRRWCKRWVETSAGWVTNSTTSHTWESDLQYSEVTDDWARFAPNLDAGTYDVQAFWGCSNDGDQRAQITVHNTSGDTTEQYNQRANNENVSYGDGDCTDSSGFGCCGYWVDIGSYTFDSGTSGYVEISRTSDSTGRTFADAVRFTQSQNELLDETDSLLNSLYNSQPTSGGTPLRTALQNVGRYYNQDDTHTGNLGTSPYATEENGGSCQQAYAIAMTDGYWNGDSPGVDNVDGGKGDPYEDSYWNTLADVAYFYYDIDLATGLPNDVGTNESDRNDRQHMVTYGISFGLDGILNPEDVDGDGQTDCPSPNYACTDANGNTHLADPYFLISETPIPAWGNPGVDDTPEKIDDLWHSAVNGRGLFFSAKDADQLVDSLTTLFNEIEADQASGSSVSVNGDELTSDTVLYQSSYESGTWIGNVTSYRIDIESGQVLRDKGDEKWQAQEQLQDLGWEQRNIITFNGTVGKSFTYDNLNDSQKIALLQDSDVVSYLRGQENTSFRSRTVMLGDIVHSAPLLVPDIKGYDRVDNDGDGCYDKNKTVGDPNTYCDEAADGSIENNDVLFAGANDGFLHAFDAETGIEKMAFMPQHVFYRIHELTDTSYIHKFFVDATPVYKRMNFWAGNQTSDDIDNDGDGDIDEFDENYSDGINNDGLCNDATPPVCIDEPWETIKFTMLVGGLNKGGKGIYALNISDIHTTTAEDDFAEMVMWEYPPVASITYGADQSNDGRDNDGDGCYDDDKTVGDASTFCDEDADGDDENYADTIDNDGDGASSPDEENELIYSVLVPNPNENPSDPDDDFIVDNDMGYTFSKPYVVKSYKSTTLTFVSPDATGYDATTSSPWVVIFGNGYDSTNGSAVLYVLDALSGELLRKIDTGANGGNGLSETAIIDVNNDGRVDYVYAGDLTGKLWKFDLTSENPDNWGVAFGDDQYNPTLDGIGTNRIDAADTNGTDKTDVPKPLIDTNQDQPITTAPDVMHHPEHGKKGFMVIFATGKYLGADDQTDTSQQTIYGVWDYGTSRDTNLGEIISGGELSNPGTSLDGVTLLEQTEVYFGKPTGLNHYLRVLSDNSVNWYTTTDCSDGEDNDGDTFKDADDAGQDPTNSAEKCIPITNVSDGLDNDRDGCYDNNLKVGDPTAYCNESADGNDETLGNIGWYFKLPFTYGHYDDTSLIPSGKSATDLAGERVIKNLFIRNGKVIVLSFIPDDSLCNGGGNSILHEMSAENGGRIEPAKPVIDINGDGILDSRDLITVSIDTNGDGTGDTEITVAPTGIMRDGILHTPVIVGDPDKDRELKIFSTSSGTTDIIWEEKESEGTFYWRER